MIEQISILDEIKERRQVEAVPQLMALYATPLGDLAVDEMVYHALFELLAGREEEILAGLAHESQRVRLLCIRQAGATALATALPILRARLLVEEDVEMVGEVIRALGKLKDPALVAVLSPFLEHDDYSVVAWTMQALVTIGGAAARDALRGVVEAGNAQLTPNDICDLRTALAIENLARFADDETIDYLVTHIHHPTPSFRRVVILALANMGPAVLPALEACLEEGDKDEKIMAANVVGMMGHREGADLLIDVLDDDGDMDPNLKFAVYEALGRINSLKSVIGLTDGLAETDEMVLMAVVTAMDHLCNPGVVKVVNEALDAGDAQSRRIARTIATAHAAKLFVALHGAGPHGDSLIDVILTVGDQEALALFRLELEKRGGEAAMAACKRLSGEAAASAVSGRKILAADDSKAILFFYKGVANELGVEMVTVPDGKDALEYLKVNSDIDLLITDMNMPNMDGVELTKEVRKLSQWVGLPIVMATTESEKSQVDLARAAGVNDFISKPFSGEQLKAKIDQMLS